MAEFDPIERFLGAYAAGDTVAAVRQIFDRPGIDLDAMAADGTRGFGWPT